MAINVTCPGCMARFTVADEHGGKTGPCPKCKKPITIPKAEEAVVIHAPTGDGPRDAKGKLVLKTEKRKDGRFDPLVATGVGGVTLLTVLGALLLKGTPAANDYPALVSGSILLGPLLVWAGYQFLRDSELEPYRNGPLWLRASIVGLACALGWGVYFLLASQVGETDWRVAGLEIWQMGFAGAVAVGVGAFAAFAALDLEPTMAALLSSMYFVVTCGLRWLMELPPVPGLKE
ncbi:MAG: hypothetical protein ACRCT8_16760 [Lacipirellulaceae bacterium]